MDVSNYHQRQCGALRAFRLRCKLAGIKPAFHRAWRQRPSPTSPPTRTTCLLKLPLEIMGPIVNDLPDFEKACLALTCRTFYWLLGDVLGSPELHHPPNMVFERDTAVDSVRRSCLRSQRWKFIRSLEEGHLLACSSCLKLHPFTEFRPNQILFKGPSSRVCRFGYYSGFVDLCPCIKLTFRDKLRLVDEWKRFLASKPDTTDAKFLWHNCWHSFLEDLVTYQTAILPRFGVDGALILDIEYRLRFKGPAWALKTLGRRVCPHHSIFEFIAFELACPLTIIPSSVVYRTDHGCPICRTTVPIFECWRADGFTCMRLTITRDLGAAEHVPDTAWYTQTSFSGDDVSLSYWYQRYPESSTNPSLMNWNSRLMTRQLRRWEPPETSRYRRQIVTL